MSRESGADRASGASTEPAVDSKRPPTALRHRLPGIAAPLWADFVKSSQVKLEPSADVQAPTHSKKFSTVNIGGGRKQAPRSLSRAIAHRRNMIYALESFVFRAFTQGAEGKASKKLPVGIDTSAMNKMMKNFDKC